MLKVEWTSHGLQGPDRMQQTLWYDNTVMHQQGTAPLDFLFGGEICRAAGYCNLTRRAESLFCYEQTPTIYKTITTCKIIGCITHNMCYKIYSQNTNYQLSTFISGCYYVLSLLLSNMYYSPAWQIYPMQRNTYALCLLDKKFWIQDKYFRSGIVSSKGTYSKFEPIHIVK